MNRKPAGFATLLLRASVVNNPADRIPIIRHPDNPRNFVSQRHGYDLRRLSIHEIGQPRVLLEVRLSSVSDHGHGASDQQPSEIFVSLFGDLITSPAYVVIKAADEFKDKTTTPNQLWQSCVNQTGCIRAVYKYKFDRAFGCRIAAPIIGRPNRSQAGGKGCRHPCRDRR